jgi:hypothetical protein
MSIEQASARKSRSLFPPTLRIIFLMFTISCIALKEELCYFAEKL